METGQTWVNTVLERALLRGGAVGALLVPETASRLHQLLQQPAPVGKPDPVGFRPVDQLADQLVVQTTPEPRRACDDPMPIGLV